MNPATRPCVTDPKGLNNNGAATLAPDDTRGIMAYDIGEWLAQYNGINDVRGLTRLRNKGGIVPFLLNTGASFTRPVFNVIPTSELADVGEPTSNVFVGGGSAVCTNSATIVRFGFAPRPDCGDTSRQTPGGPTLPD